MPRPAPDAPTLSWSTGRSRTTATWTPIHDKSWSSFVEWLCLEEPAASKEVRPYVGGTLKHGRRTIRTVEQRFFLTLDADYADVDFPFDVADLLHDTPYLIHTTWRHTVEAHRYRLVVPLSRGVEPNDYKQLAWTLMHRLDGKRFDVTTAQAERFMWSPSSADRATYFQTSANAGSPYLPVDEWLDGHHGPSETPEEGGQGKGTTGTPASRSEAYTPPVATEEDKERAIEILLKACDQVEHVYEREDFAGRNEAVFHWMPLLFRFAGAGALDEETVTEALWDAAQRVSADEPYEQAEFDASIRSARQYVEESGPALPDTTPTRMAQADFEDVDLEVDLWDKTDRLKHVAQAADAVGRNRLALLSLVLVRVLHEAPPGIYLPGVGDGGVGSRTALNLGVALVGSSGQGKTMLNMKSRELMAVPNSEVDLTPSTGQGLIASYMRWDADAQENRLKEDPRGFFYTDEIDTLGALGKDAGSTLLSEMRTLLTGGSTGSANATKDRQRALPAGSYSFQIVAGVQPTRAGALLDGRDAGTPQRFIWVPVTNPKTALPPDDRPEWPGELGWSDPFLLAFEFGDPIVRYPDWLRDELKEYDYRISQETSHGGELSRHGHQNLLRLKVAAGVAFLHESHVIEDLHVEIADMILAASRRTQLECEKAVAEMAHLKRKAAKKSEERVAEEMTEERLAKLVKNARGALLRAKGEWVRGQELRPRPGDREAYTEPIWEALAAMEDVECEEEQRGSRVIRKARIKDE